MNNRMKINLVTLIAFMIGGRITYSGFVESDTFSSSYNSDFNERVNGEKIYIANRNNSGKTYLEGENDEIVIPNKFYRYNKGKKNDIEKIDLSSVKTISYTHRVSSESAVSIKVKGISLHDFDVKGDIDLTNLEKVEAKNKNDISYNKPSYFDINNIKATNIKAGSLKQIDYIYLNEVEVESSINLKSVNNVKDIEFEKVKTGFIDLSGLEKTNNIDLNNVDSAKDINFSKLNKANNIKLNTVKATDINFSNLSNVDSVELNNVTSPDINFSNLSNANGVKLNNVTSQDIDFSNLSNAISVELNNVTSPDINFSNLSNASSVELNRVYGDVNLSKMTSVDNIKINNNFSDYPSNVNLSKLETITSDYIFEGEGITRLKLDNLTKINISEKNKEPKLKYRFKGTKSKIELPKIKEITNMDYMFNDFNTANGQTELNLSTLEGKETVSAYGVFNSDEKTKIKKLDMSGFLGTNLKNAAKMFSRAKRKPTDEYVNSNYYGYVDVSKMNLENVEKTTNMLDDVQADRFDFGTITSKEVLGNIDENTLGNTDNIKDFNFVYRDVEGNSILNLFEYKNANYYVIPYSSKETINSKEDLAKYLNSDNKKEKLAFIKPEEYNNPYVNRTYYKYTSDANNTIKLNDTENENYKFDPNITVGPRVFLVESPFYVDKRVITGQDLVDLAKAAGTELDSSGIKFKSIGITGGKGIEVIKEITDNEIKYKINYTGKDEEGGTKIIKTSNENQPGEGNNKPGEENNIPGEGNNKPGEGNNKPGEGNNKPGEGNNKPGEGNNKPGEGNNKPGEISLAINKEITKAVEKANNAIEKANTAISGVANAVAMANLLQVSSNSNKRHQISAGYGMFEGEHALALGFSGITKNRNFTYRLSGSVNSKGKFAFGAGVGLMIGSETNYVPNDEVFDLKKEVKDLKAKNREFEAKNIELERRLELLEKRLNLK